MNELILSFYLIKDNYMQRRNYRIEKDLDLDYFIKICNESNHMSEACAKLNLHFNSFKRIALKLGCYKVNRSNYGRKFQNKNDPRKISLKEIIEGKHPSYQTLKLKNRLFLEGYKEKFCEVCHNSMWLGQPIALELDHIDGNSNNHLFENLRIICPNCHAMTKTYRGKNKKA